jgi:hypothetical protein
MALEEDAPSATMSYPPGLVFLPFSHGFFALVIDSKYHICDRSQNLVTTSNNKRRSDDCTPEASKRYSTYCCNLSTITSSLET